MSGVITLSLLIRIVYNILELTINLNNNNSDVTVGFYGFLILFSEFIPFSALLLSTLSNSVNEIESKIKKSDDTSREKILEYSLVTTMPPQDKEIMTNSIYGSLTMNMNNNNTRS
jgi:hypothetical protein